MPNAPESLLRRGRARAAVGRAGTGGLSVLCPTGSSALCSILAPRVFAALRFEKLRDVAFVEAGAAAFLSFSVVKLCALYFNYLGSFLDVVGTLMLTPSSSRGWESSLSSSCDA